MSKEIDDIFKNNKSIEKPWGKTPVDVIYDTDPNELKLYIVLASFQGGNSYSFPKLPAIAARARLPESACSKAISGLVRKGWVQRKRIFGKGNAYVVLSSVYSQQEIESEKQEELKKAKADRFKRNLSKATKDSYYPIRSHNSNESDHYHPNGSDHYHPIHSDEYIEKNIRKEHLENNKRGEQSGSKLEVPKPKEDPASSSPTYPMGIEQLFAKEFEKLSKELYPNKGKLRFPPFDGGLIELIGLCDGKIEILKEKLEVYKNLPSSHWGYHQTRGLAPKIIVQIWNDLAFVPGTETTKEETPVKRTEKPARGPAAGDPISEIRNTPEELVEHQAKQLFETFHESNNQRMQELIIQIITQPGGVWEPLKEKIFARYREMCRAKGIDTLAA